MIEAGKPEVLVVEDRNDDAGLVEYALSRYDVGVRVRLARDGEEALDYVGRIGPFPSSSASQRPKVIFLDIELPKLNGLEVLGRLKSNPETRMIPVVVLTAIDDEARRLESYRLGANSFIVKPLELKSYNDVVARAALYWVKRNVAPD